MKIKISIITFVLMSVVCFGISQQAFAVTCPQFKAIYKNGSKDKNSSDIKNLQQLLYSKKYLNVKPTGYFGPATRTGLIKLQKDFNLKLSGITDVQTQKVLNDLMGCNPPDAEKDLVVKFREESNHTIKVQIMSESGQYKPSDVIKFSWSGANGKDKLFAYLQNEKDTKINSKYLGAGDGSALMTTSNTIESGIYTIIIINEKGEILGMSNSISIKAENKDMIKIVLPNGGEKWLIGKEYRIMWSSNERVLTEPVTLFLEKKESNTKIMIAQNTPNTRYYYWTADKMVPPGEYKLVITTKNGEFRDESDGHIRVD